MANFIILHAHLKTVEKCKVLIELIAVFHQPFWLTLICPFSQPWSQYQTTGLVPCVWTCRSVLGEPWQTTRWTGGGDSGVVLETSGQPVCTWYSKRCLHVWDGRSGAAMLERCSVGQRTGCIGRRRRGGGRGRCSRKVGRVVRRTAGQRLVYRRGPGARLHVLRAETGGRR